MKQHNMYSMNKKKYKSFLLSAALRWPNASVRKDNDGSTSHISDVIPADLDNLN